MALFRRENPSASGSGAASDLPSPSPSSSSSSSSSAQRRRVTHVAAGSRVEGKLSGPTELLIEGEVHGEIQVESAVMIGSEGVVYGPISAQVVRVGGRVVGDVQATERVEVAPSGSLEGDIAAPRVIIAEGSFFKGRVEMRSEKDNKDKASEPRRKGGDAGAPQKAAAESGK